MNSRERVTAALQGQPVDRRPVSLVLGLYGSKLTDCPLSEYYRNPAAFARGQAAVLETFRPDLVFGPFALPLEAAAFGSEVRHFDRQPPNVVRPAIASADELDQLTIPDVDSHPLLTFFRDAVRLLVVRHGRRTPVAAIASSPTDLPALLLGIEGWLNALLFDEDGARRLMEITVAHWVRWAEALFADGADLVVIPAGFVNPALVSRPVVERITGPVLRDALSRVDGLVVLHSGGNTFAPYLDLLAGLPNVVAFVLNGGDSFTEAREKAGADQVVVGNVDGPTLFQRGREEIREDCLRALRNRVADPHFILGTSAADIGLDTPPENIHVIREAAEEFGSGENDQ